MDYSECCDCLTDHDWAAPILQNWQRGGTQEIKVSKTLGRSGRWGKNGEFWSLALTPDYLDWNYANTNPGAELLTRSRIIPQRSCDSAVLPNKDFDLSSKCNYHWWFD